MKKMIRGSVSAIPYLLACVIMMVALNNSVTDRIHAQQQQSKATIYDEIRQLSLELQEKAILIHDSAQEIRERLPEKTGQKRGRVEDLDRRIEMLTLAIDDLVNQRNAIPE